MSDPILIEVAKAVHAELDAASLSISFTPVLDYETSELNLAAGGAIQVDVVPVKWTVRQSARGRREYACFVDVGVREKFGGGEKDASTGKIVTTEVDTRMRLLEQIEQYFGIYEPTQDGRRLTTVPDAVLDPDAGVEVVVAMAREHLRKNRQYTGIVRLKFLVDRSL